MSRRKKRKYLLSKGTRGALIQDIVDTLNSCDNLDEKYIDAVVNGYHKPALMRMSDEQLITECEGLNMNCSYLSEDDESADDVPEIRKMINEAKNELETAGFHKEVKRQLKD